MKKHSIFIFAIIMLALGIGLWREHHVNIPSINQINANSPLKVGTLLGRTQKLPAFHLVNQDNQPFSHHEFKNRWSLVFFGYSQCPDVCPLTLHAMSQIHQHLRQITQIQYVFITIDPERDLPSVLKELLQQEEYKHVPFTALTGDRETINNLTKLIGIHVTQADPSNGNIEHSGTLLLINPEGKLAALFTATNQPNLIAQDLKTLMHLYATT